MPEVQHGEGGFDPDLLTEARVPSLIPHRLRRGLDRLHDKFDAARAADKAERDEAAKASTSVHR